MLVVYICFCLWVKNFKASPFAVGNENGTRSNNAMIPFCLIDRFIHLWAVPFSAFYHKNRLPLQSHTIISARSTACFLYRDIGTSALIPSAGTFNFRMMKFNFRMMKLISAYLTSSSGVRCINFFLDSHRKQSTPMRW